MLPAVTPGDMGWPPAQQGRAGVPGSCHHLRCVVKVGGSLVPWLPEAGGDGGKQRQCEIHVMDLNWL